ncbi:hypothetical protein D6827_01890 [Candidatus Parcubacteria bacterium]|nr:MAG: hypothetical protein D6827_01890 [Candidatus Parcubacteria bacterium]
MGLMTVITTVMAIATIGRVTAHVVIKKSRIATAYIAVIAVHALRIAVMQMAVSTNRMEGYYGL